MSNLEQIVEVIETYRADIDALIENESEEMCISILQTMTDAYENDISTSVTSKGMQGWNNSPPTQGLGFKYNGVNLMYDGGFCCSF